MYTGCPAIALNRSGLIVLLGVYALILVMTPGLCAPIGLHGDMIIWKKAKEESCWDEEALGEHLD